jgi:hypothetical protein
MAVVTNHGFATERYLQWELGMAVAAEWKFPFEAPLAH